LLAADRSDVMRRVYLAATFAVSATPAFAHPDVGHLTGFAHGFVHPLGGADHVLAMIAVGLLAARLGGAALALVPLSFLAMMAAGGVLGAAGIPMPLAETGIGLSVVALGASLALQLRIPLVGAMAFAGLCAMFHGHAHGSEMPAFASAFGYGAGFVLATGLLHLAGIAVGLGFARLSEAHSRRMDRIAGGAMALSGAGMLAGTI
jgi:urease accessory protein